MPDQSLIVLAASAVPNVEEMNLRLGETIKNPVGAQNMRIERRGVAVLLRADQRVMGDRLGGSLNLCFN
jgi:hypothetical protein